MPVFRGVLGCLVVCCLAGVGSAHAAGIRISPVVVEMPAVRQPGVVSVFNDSDKPLTFQGQALAWRQDAGRDVFEPTDDLLVVPVIAEIAPGGSQLFRVALRRPTPAPVERTYRLVLEDITPQDESGAVAFRYAHNLPVLIAPQGPIVRLVRWRECSQAQPERTGESRDARCVRLQNAGNRRIKIERVELESGGQRRGLDLPGGVNLLAGAFHEVVVPRARAGSAPIESLKIVAAGGDVPTVPADF